MSYGDIYKATCIITNKSYIGQAKKHQGKFDNKWGYEKRWNSHIKEALKSKSDHCSYLNNAIRKYGYKNFTLELVDEADTKELLDELEKKYIQQFNTMVPDGYNLDSGGNKGYIVSEQTKLKISKTQMGIRKNKFRRKYEEDNDLPKNIIALRNEKKEKIGFKILNFPIGIDKPDYINKYFYHKHFEYKLDKCLQATKDYLDELKEQYKHICKNNVDNEDDFKPVPQKKTEKKKNKLPEYIYPLYNNEVHRLLIGYYVEGPDYPKKEFTGKTNRWNLNSAKKYIIDIDIQNKNKNFIIPPLPDDLPKTRQRKNVNDNKLPKYMFSVKDPKNKDNIIGFSLKINSIILENGKPYSRTFAHPKQTLEEKYNVAIQELRTQLTTHNITN